MKVCVNLQYVTKKSLFCHYEYSPSYLRACKSIALVFFVWVKYWIHKRTFTTLVKSIKRNNDKNSRVFPSNKYKESSVYTGPNPCSSLIIWYPNSNLDIKIPEIIVFYFHIFSMVLPHMYVYFKNLIHLVLQNFEFNLKALSCV